MSNEVTNFAKEVGAMQSSIATQTEAINRLSDDLQRYTETHTEFARGCIKSIALNDKKSSAAHRRVDMHDKQLNDISKWVKDMDKIVQPLIVTNKIMVFIGGGLGISVMGLIWAIIVGQVQLVFP